MLYYSNDRRSQEIQKSATGLAQCGYYRPIPAIYFAVLFTLFASQPFYYHLVQIVLHITNAWLVFLFFRKLLRKSIAFVFAIIFLIHPINVESVAYIAASQSELFFLFGMVALLISTNKKVTSKQIFLISLLSLFSLLTKETGFLFVLMILLLQFIFRRNRFFTVLTIESIVVAIYFLIRFLIGGVFFEKFVTINPVPISFLPLTERLANVPAIVLYYLTAVFFPLRLIFLQKWVITKITVLDFFIPLLIDSVFFALISIEGVYLYIHQKRKFAAFFFFFIWFISGICMLLQIFPLDMTVSDRWFYFPLVGILGIGGVGLQTVLFSKNTHGDVVFRYEKEKMLLTLFVCLLILFLSVRTIVRNTNFHDDMTLFSHDAKLQDNFNLEDSLGVTYAGMGDKEAAYIHLEKSVQLYPYSSNLLHLGNFYEFEGNLQKAQDYYYKALTSANNYYTLHNTRNKGESDVDIYTSLTKVLIESGKFNEAEKISNEGVRYYPQSSILWKALTISAFNIQNQAEAIVAAKQAKTIAPGDTTDLLYSLIANNQGMPSVAISTIMNQ